MPSEREAIIKLITSDPKRAEWLGEMLKEGKLKTLDEITDDDKIIVVGNSHHGGETGSQQVQCACGKAVWLSPSTVAMMKQREGFPTRMLCVSCFEEEIEKEQ